MIKDKLIKDFLGFSLEANTRSTINIEDGLKPVHRRILFDMGTLSKANKDFIGSAKIVGDTLGAFHPHGDSSVYDAAVRLSQPFKTRYPLIDFKGNYGSLAQPSGWAHQRYTKMKISPLGLELLRFTKVADMVETYDGENKEPVTLPTLIPIALLNGTLGIGVGLASSMAPHNLREIIAATEYLLSNPNATTEQLMKYVKGPDFPTGGQIINPERLLDVYESGTGSVKLRANYNISQNGGKTSIVITEVPFLVDPEEKIIKPIVTFHQEGYPYIEDVINHTGKDNPFKLEIILTKGAPVYEVLEKLHRETGIETSFTINNTVYLGNNKFQKMGLKELLNNYIKSGIKTLVKQANYDLKVAELRLEIVEGLIKAIINIEEIIEIIKSSKDVNDAFKKLIAAFSFTERQTNAILDMKLSRLTNLDKEKLSGERNDLIKKIEYLKDFITNKELQISVFLKEIKELARKFGDTRRTRIEGAANIAEGEIVDIHLFMNQDGSLYGIDELPSNRRNTKGKAIPEVQDIVTVPQNKPIYVAAENGTLTPIDAMSLYTGASDSLLNGSDMFKSRPIQFINWEDKDFIVTYSANGKLKKTSITEYKKEKHNSLCKLSDGDSLLKVFFANDDDVLVGITTKNKYVAFPVSEIRETSRNTIGSKASGEDLLSLSLLKDFFLVWNDEAKGKLVKAKDIQMSGRRNSGYVIGNAVGGEGVKKSDRILIQGSDRKSIFIDASSVSVAQVAAIGVALYNGKISKILTI